MQTYGLYYALDLWDRSRFREVLYKWSQTDFVGQMLRLRGEAKTLFSLPDAPEERLEQARQKWQEQLKLWLCDRELNVTDSSVVKQHAMLALKNLMEGPFDESSKQLFDMSDWMF